METIKLWARNGATVRQAIELGELVHLETASEELTDEFLLFAIQSGLLSKWAKAFPDPRQEPEISMEVILASHLAARFAGLYSMRKAGYVLRSATVLGALGDFLKRKSFVIMLKPDGSEYPTEATQGGAPSGIRLPAWPACLAPPLFGRPSG